MSGGGQVFIVDTSSLLDVRKVFGGRDEKRVFALLSSLVTSGQLVYPPEVAEEVVRGGKLQPDAAGRWINKTRALAERRVELDRVRIVLSVAPDLVDTDNPHDEADPYVIALGLELRSEELTLDLVERTEVTIVTEDRNDKPSKLSLTTAAGMLGVPSIPLFALVRVGGISP